MAETPSTMLPLGTELPDFSLTNVRDGSTFDPGELEESQALLIMFICNHCPFVKHVQDELGRLAEDYLPRGLGIIAINSNDVDSYPQDGPDKMKALAEEKGWPFPFLLDETQEVAKTFRAACTPDFFLFGPDRTLVYRGQLDDSRPGNEVPVTGRDLRAAIEDTLTGRTPAPDQRPSVGCNIKWRPGNEPDYF